MILLCQYSLRKIKHTFYVEQQHISSEMMGFWHENSNYVYAKEAKTHVDPVHPNPQEISVFQMLPEQFTSPPKSIINVIFVVQLQIF